ncbi:CLUMA_CG019631, isoform A, partial [Clunio marinus]
MNLKRLESYNKIQEFLEDIYMYLNNNNSTTQSHDEIEHQKLNEKRKELIDNCKHIRSIFEAEFHPHDDVDSSSYLDMNGAGMNRNRHRQMIVDGNKNESTKEDYINMSEKIKAENAYDIYETTSSLEQQKNNDKCPYTGLPAAHLKIMNSTQVGLLIRIEKRLFLTQTKDFYVGILEKWILLYPSKANDMKPSECFYPTKIENDKGENQFNVVTNVGKRFHFQAANAEEFHDWMKNIQKIIEDGETSTVRDSPSSQLSFRKLPSPPLHDNESDEDEYESRGEEEIHDCRSSSENYYGFNRSSNQTVINTDERLYEVPSASTRCEEIKNDEEKPPMLPIKTGKRVEDDVVHCYDVPKSRKPFSEHSLSSSPSPEPSGTVNMETSDKSRTKVSEMTAILSTINLVSPEEKRKSTHVSKKIQTPDKNETEKRMSPMKTWFSKQINRSKKRLSRREKTPEVVDDITTPVKGSKVNMIINQLEKNGQLKVLSKSLKNRKSLISNDGEDYET